MKTTSAVAALALAGSSAAQSICDKYSTALLGNTSAGNEYALLKYLVNTAVIGNGNGTGVPKPSIPGVTFPTNVTVTGILGNGTYNGSPVNLLPYFDGGLASSNRGGMAYAVNFLDDGGATPLQSNNPANGTSSNQYMLLTHLYQFFGSALGCTGQSNTTGSGAFPAYAGVPSQYTVHKFMDLDANQVGYFIEQVGLSALSFGVSTADATAVGKLLNGAFGAQCAAAVPLYPASAGPQLQSICIAPDCPVAANASISSCPYSAPVIAGIANSTLAQGLGNSSNTATASYSASGSMASTMSGMTSTGTAASVTAVGGSSGSSAPTGSATVSGASTLPSSAAADVKVAGSFITALIAAFAFAL